MEHHSFSRLLLVFSVLALCLGNQGVRCELSYGYYDNTCPQLYTVVQQHVFAAMRAEMRMGASLLRLHFHDCFVNVTDTYFECLLMFCIYMQLYVAVTEMV